MKTARTTGLDDAPTTASRQIHALWDAEATTAAELERTIQRLASRLEAWKLESRQLSYTNSRALHKHSSYVAHMERFAVEA
jgi:hypothetical protein